MKKIKLIIATLVCVMTIFPACRKNEFSQLENGSKAKVELETSPKKAESLQHQILEDIETLAALDFSSTPMPQTEQQAAILISTLQSNSIIK